MKLHGKSDIGITLADAWESYGFLRELSPATVRFRLPICRVYAGKRKQRSAVATTIVVDAYPRMKSLIIFVQCFPQDRDWVSGEKCMRCQRGGQACGPNVQHYRSNTASSAHATTPAAAPTVPILSGIITQHRAGCTNNTSSTNRSEDLSFTEGHSSDGSSLNAWCQSDSLGCVSETVVPSTPWLQMPHQPSHESEVAAKWYKTGFRKHCTPKKLTHSLLQLHATWTLLHSPRGNQRPASYSPQRY